jgi:hypothetical protein
MDRGDKGGLFLNATTIDFQSNFGADYVASVRDAAAKQAS